MTYGTYEILSAIAIYIPSGLLHGWRSEYPVEHPGVFAETVVLELKGWFHIFVMCQGRFTHYIGDGEPSHLQ